MGARASRMTRILVGQDGITTSYSYPWMERRRRRLAVCLFPGTGKTTPPIVKVSVITALIALTEMPRLVRF